MKLEKVLEVVRIKQVVQETETERFQIKSPDDAIDFIQEMIGDEDREVFLVVCLNTKNEVMAVHRAHVGSINSSVVHPREVFKSAILNNATSLIFSHNHPSYNCTPSREDIEVTKRLVATGQLLGIEVLDHIIVGENSHCSLREKGYM